LYYDRSMASTEQLRAETGRLSRLLVYSADDTKAHFASAIQSLGLSVPAARALLQIVTPIPMRELAGNLAYDPSYLTGLADELEQAGLLVRVAGTDRRVKLLQLTEAGEEMRTNIGKAVGVGEPLSERLDAADRAELLRILEKLRGN